MSLVREAGAEAPRWEGLGEVGAGILREREERCGWPLREGPWGVCDGQWSDPLLVFVIALLRYHSQYIQTTHLKCTGTSLVAQWLRIRLPM